MNKLAFNLGVKAATEMQQASANSAGDAAGTAGRWIADTGLAQARGTAAKRLMADTVQRAEGYVQHLAKNPSTGGFTNPATLTRMGKGFGGGLVADYLGNKLTDQMPNGYVKQVTREALPMASGAVAGFSTGGVPGAVWGAAAGTAEPVWHDVREGAGLAKDHYNIHQQNVAIQNTQNRIDPAVKTVGTAVGSGGTNTLPADRKSVV